MTADLPALINAMAAAHSITLVMYVVVWPQ